MRNGLLLSLVLVVLGCQSEPAPSPRSSAESALFGPVAMRIHPIFTRVKDWTGDNKPDGVEALVELQDQFGDPTKAAGRVIFELYSFQKFDPQRKGNRLVNPWIGSLMTLEEQRDRWNRTSRTYSFPLSYSQVSEDQTYVLTAQFETASGQRFFDELILEPARGAYAPKEREKDAATQPIIPVQPAAAPGSANGPTTEPGMRTPAP
jgi:hypothetical protein